MLINGERHVATIQKIAELSPIKGADRIEIATILGWTCVVQKGRFAVGDLCIYIEIDAFLPSHFWDPIFPLPNNTLRVQGGLEGKSVSVVKLKGQKSFGLVLKPEDFPSPFSEQLREYALGESVQNLLGVSVYSPEILHPEGIGLFPYFIQKTDCERWQNRAEELFSEEGLKRECYAELKYDGESVTVFYDVESERGFRIASKELELKFNVERSPAREVAKITNLGNLLRARSDLAVQGELCGKEEKTEPIFVIFDIFSYAQQRFLTLGEKECLLSEFRIPQKNIALAVFKGIFGQLSGGSPEKLVEWGKSLKKCWSPRETAEGMVIKFADSKDKIKVINY